MSPRDDLSRLFHEAVDHVEPRPGLDAIRARVSEEAAMSPRLKILAPLAAAAAVATIAGGFLLTSGGDPGGSPDTPPATSPTGTAEPSPTSPSPTEPETEPEPEPEPPVERVAAAVYYVGDTPHGPRLYREFVRVPGNDRLEAAVDLAIGGDMRDPDYRTLWPRTTGDVQVSLDGVGEDGTITVDLPNTDLHDRPSGMTEREAQLAIQQVIYTAQGAAGGRIPVQFLMDGNHTDAVLGVPTSEPLANDNPVETLSLVNISSPGEGEVVTGDSLKVTGVANSFEATVPLRVLQGSKVLWEGFATAEGCCEEKLFPFTTTVDVSRLVPGTYLLEASTSDPTGGAEGPGPFVDTKTITIR